MTQQDDTDLAARAMISKLKISIWGAHTYDKDAGAEVISNRNASEDAGRFSKRLLEKSVLQPIRAVETAARQTHGELTLPWQNDGARILPSRLYMTYRREMKKHQDAFDRELDQVLAGYPEAIEKRRSQLGDMFNETDYPSPAELAGKFGFELLIHNLPNERDFRVDLGQEAIDEIKEGMKKQTADMYQGMTDDAQRRLVGAVSKLAERLRDFDPEKHRLRKSVLGNVTDLLDILPDLNLADDPRITELTTQARSVVEGLNSDDLRDDQVIRQDTVEAADRLMADAAAMFS